MLAGRSLLAMAMAGTQDRREDAAAAALHHLAGPVVQSGAEESRHYGLV